MKYVLSLVVVGLVVFLTTQRTRQKTAPAENAAKQDFTAGFTQLFVTQCSGASPGKTEWCRCMLQVMISEKAITPSMEDLEKSQLLLHQWQSSEQGVAAKSRCSSLQPPEAASGVKPAIEPTSGAHPATETKPAANEYEVALPQTE